jgi:polyisoprenoid-binding protein YceI
LKKKIVSILVPAALSLPALAAETYTVDPGHTYPSFEISHLGFSTMRGTFDASRGTISLDPAGNSGSIDITIDAASLDTGHAKRDEHLRNEEFFNVAKFPTLTYKASKLRFNGDKLVGADGKLTLLGVTRPVSLQVTSFNCGAHPMTKKQVCGANATATIQRSQFGMMAYVPAVGDEVKISIEVEAVKN